MVASPSKTEPLEPVIAGVEAGYVDRIRIALKGEAPYVFAKRAGISKSYMYEVLAGSKAPSLAFFSSLAETAGIRPDWLISGRGMPNEDWNRRTALIPRITIGMDALPSDGGNQVLVELDRLGEVLPSRAAALSAPDDGLSPLIDIGDDLIVEVQPANIRDGQIYLVRTLDRFILRKFKLVEPGTMLMLLNDFTMRGGSAEQYLEDSHRVHSRILIVSKKVG